MKLQRVVPFLLLMSSAVIAQIQSPSASTAGGFASPASSSQGQKVWVLGKVAIEGASTSPGPVTVVLRCGQEERARVTSSSKGDFSIMIGHEDLGEHRMFSGEGFSSMQQCELQADSPDYISETLHIFAEGVQDINQAGTIVLHPRVVAHGDIVSVTSLAAPEKAKQAFQKGQEQERKGKWQAACDFFRKAVEVYPQYAIAWLELGRTQVKQNEFASAKQSLYEATSHDAHLVDAYEELARIALVQQRWRDLADSTQNILRVAPNPTVNVWYLNSAANFNLGDLELAEAGATRGLDLDKEHKVPQLEYLYALILSRRGALSPALEHMRAFLKFAPNDPQAQSANEMLGELEKRVGSAPVSQ